MFKEAKRISREKFDKFVDEWESDTAEGQRVTPERAKAAFEKGLQLLREKYQEAGEWAAQNDGWMRMDEFHLKDFVGRAEDAWDLVFLAQQGWEETDHFNIKYGAEMSDDVSALSRATGYSLPDGAGVWAIEELRPEFWEGYVDAHRPDPYKTAERLMKRKGRS